MVKKLLALVAFLLLTAEPFAAGRAGGTETMPAQGINETGTVQENPGDKAEKRTLTEDEAKEVARKRLQRGANMLNPRAEVVDVVAETSDAYIIEGFFYRKNGEKDSMPYYCAVHKVSGKCGVLLLSPQVKPGKDFFKDFAWSGWPILY